MTISSHIRRSGSYGKRIIQPMSMRGRWARGSSSVAASGSQSTYFDLLVEYGATHLWKLDEASGTPADSIGVINATATGAPSYQEAGPGRGVTYAMGFNGTTYLSPVLDMTALQPFSFGLLFREPSASANSPGLLADWSSSAGPLLLMGASSTISIYYNGSSLSVGVAAPATWHMLVATYDSGVNSFAWKSYLDSGTARTSSTAGGGLTASGDTALRIGTYAAGAGGVFNGRIAGVFVVPRVLTSSEVGALATSLGF